MEGCFERGSELLEHKLELDSLNRAISIVEEKDLGGSTEGLLKRRVQLEHENTAFNKKLLSILTDSDNVLRLEELWYAVRYVTTKGKPLVGIFAIDDDDLELFKVSHDRSRGLTQGEVDTLVPAMEDEATKAIYLNRVEKNAASILVELDIIKEDGVEAIGSISVSNHACKRWTQRKLQIYNENKVTKYLKSNEGSIKRAIISSYEESECVWVDQEEIEYWLNEENIVFVVGNNTIITLYEKDFGFSPQINRDIVNSQLEVIKEDWKLLQESEKNYLGSIDELNLKSSQINTEIEVLEEKIDCLKLEQEVLQMKKKVLSNSWRCRKQEFKQEFGKLFSRHKSK